MQLRDGNANLATTDKVTPYGRDVVLGEGAYTITVRWTKNGTPIQTSAPRTVTCP
jgi:hypothetical protein